MNDKKGKKIYWYILYIFILIFSFICSYIFAFYFFGMFYSNNRHLSFLYLVIQLIIFISNHVYLNWLLNRNYKWLILLFSYISIMGFPIFYFVMQLCRF